MISISEIVSYVPLWAWTLIALGLFMGLSATRQKTVKLVTSTILPLVFIAMTTTNLLDLGPRFPIVVLAWGIAFLLGGLVGWFIIQKAPIAVNKGKLSLVVPGTWAVLWLFLVAVVAKFALGILAGYRSPLANDPAVLSILLACCGFCTGGILGRTARLYSWYISAFETRR